MGLEFFILAICLVISWHLSANWYNRLFSAWGPARSQFVKTVLILLPSLALAAMIYTLVTAASFDVIGSIFYIFFYVAMGGAFIQLGLFLMAMAFDLSWIDDVFNLNNLAALPAFSGGLLGLTAIYCGANIGDGPGWWCVLFAGGLGLGAWLALGALLARGTDVFERITVERDVPCGIRAGCYLLASGLILGRASAGDWSGFYSPLLEFFDGWPALILTALALAVERLAATKDFAEIRQRIYRDEGFPAAALFWGLFYLALALIAIMLLPPLRENPQYAEAGWFILTGWANG